MGKPNGAKGGKGKKGGQKASHSNNHQSKKGAPAAHHVDPLAAPDPAVEGAVEEVEGQEVSYVDPLSELLAEEEKEQGMKKNSKKRRKNKNAPPPKKPGETKAQYEERCRLEQEGLEEFVAHPPSGARMILPDPNDFEEEEPEKAETNDDYSDTANERAREYRKGGYHPVVVGELYDERYRIVQKLGWGYFSTVWLVWDYKKEKFQAMKIQKSAEHYREAAFDEIKLLSQIMGADPNGDMCCARMTDSFEHKGPNGKHVCMLFDLLGENLLSLIERYENRGIPIPIVKSIARETLIGLHHIHSINIIHTDIKPENVLLSSPKHKIHRIMRKYKPPPMSERPALLERDVSMMTKSQRKRYYQKLKKQKSKNGDPNADPDVEGSQDEADAKKETEKKETNGEDEDKPAEEDEAESETDPEWEVERFHHVSLADFGNSCWTDVQFTSEVQTRQYRAPEVIIGDPYSTPIDLWSAACMFFELLTGEFLFDPKARDDYPRDEDHLALMTELLGPLPESMRTGNGKFRAQFFDSKGNFRHIRELTYWSLADVLHDKYHFSRKKAREIAQFLLPMLALDPFDRATALEMLTHFEQWFEVQEDDYSPLCYANADAEDEEEEGEDDFADVLDDGEEEEEVPDESTIDEDLDEEDEEDHRDDADIDLLAPGDSSKENISPNGESRKAKAAAAGGKQGKVKRHRAHRPSPHHDDEAEWIANHPILAPEKLARHGLTVEDIQVALKNESLGDAKKDAAARHIIEQLIGAEGPE